MPEDDKPKKKARKSSAAGGSSSSSGPVDGADTYGYAYGEYTAYEEQAAGAAYEDERPSTSSGRHHGKSSSGHGKGKGKDKSR